MKSIGKYNVLRNILHAYVCQGINKTIRSSLSYFSTEKKKKLTKFREKNYSWITNILVVWNLDVTNGLKVENKENATVNKKVKVK